MGTMGQTKFRRQGRLQLEALEGRVLLTAVVTGVEPDGDNYEVRLTGPGTITNVDLDELTLAGTTTSSRLAITVVQVAGDGAVAVGQVNTGGAALGSLAVQGDLGGLTVGRLGQLEARSLGTGEEATGEFTIGGATGRVTVSGDVRDVNLTIAGNLEGLQVGGKASRNAQVSGSTLAIAGAVGRIQVQVMTAGSAVQVGGDLGLLNVDRWLVDTAIAVEGTLGKLNVAGGMRGGCTLEVEGDVADLAVKKDITDATITIGGMLQRGKIGTDLRDSTLQCAGINDLQVGDDLDNVRMSVTDDLVRLRAEDCLGLTLRVSGALHDLEVRRDLEGAVISALNGIGTVQVGQDVNRSLLLAGIDIGADLTMDTGPGGDDAEWGNVTIERVRVGGDLIDTSLAAGVNARGAWFGDGDDEPTAGDTGTARILRLEVRGVIASSGLPGESYAISAADGVDMARSGGTAFTGVPGVVLQEF